MNDHRIDILISGAPLYAIVPIEIVHLETGKTVRTLARAGIKTAVDVAAGPLYVQAILADGQVLSTPADAKDAEIVVLTSESTELQGGEGFSMSQVEGTEIDPYRGAWARLWRPELETGQATATWVAERVEPHSLQIDRSRLSWEIGGAGGCALQIGGQSIPRRCVLLPPSDNVTVTLAYTGQGTQDFEAGYTLTAHSGDEYAEALLAYHAAGELTAARTIANEYLSTSSDGTSPIFKKADPLKDIVGGYYLLRTHRLDPDEEWPRHLVKNHPALPDAAAVRVGQLLLASKLDCDELLGLVEQAVRCGLPSYTDGLRLLYQAVELVATVRSGEQLATWYAWLRKYADATDWNATLISFRGDPLSPTVERLTGVPDDRDIMLLADAEASILAEESVLLEVPLQEAYEGWNAFEDEELLTFAHESVIQRDQRPFERVGWQVTSGAVRQNAEATFHRVDAERTRVNLTIERPTSAIIGVILAMPVDPLLRIRGNLRSFKERIEGRPGEAGSGTVQ